ncbi:MAG: ORF6N domain-containing protein [Muribaculaceae bacterium]|nr:ORF6N domain-containing protein [Muribaculaceae bacterium]
MEEQKETIKTTGNNILISTHIENLIHIIRGQQVMIDSDLAKLYGVETKRLKEQVKRNINRFPSDFFFELTKEEFQGLRSQIATSNEVPVRGGRRYLPYAFTENGVAMLSSVLKSETAIEVNIRIMRAFTAMRSFVLNNPHIFNRLEAVEHHQLLLQNGLAETKINNTQL